MGGSNSRPSGSKPDALIHCANWSRGVICQIPGVHMWVARLAKLCDRDTRATHTRPFVNATAMQHSVLSIAGSKVVTQASHADHANLRLPAPERRDVCQQLGAARRAATVVAISTALVFPAHAAGTLAIVPTPAPTEVSRFRPLPKSTPTSLCRSTPLRTQTKRSGSNVPVAPSEHVISCAACPSGRLLWTGHGWRTCLSTGSNSSAQSPNLLLGLVHALGLLPRRLAGGR